MKRIISLLMVFTLLSPPAIIAEELEEFLSFPAGVTDDSTMTISYGFESFKHLRKIHYYYDYYRRSAIGYQEQIDTYERMLDIKDSQIQVLEDRIQIIDDEKTYYRDKYLKLSEECGTADSDPWMWAGWGVAIAVTLVLGGVFTYAEITQ